MVSNYAKETDDVLLNVIACDTVCDLFMHVTDHRKSEQIVVFFSIFFVSDFKTFKYKL